MSSSISSCSFCCSAVSSCSPSRPVMSGDWMSSPARAGSARSLSCSFRRRACLQPLMPSSVASSRASERSSVSVSSLPKIAPLEVIKAVGERRQLRARCTTREAGQPALLLLAPLLQLRKTDVEHVPDGVHGEGVPRGVLSRLLRIVVPKAIAESRVRFAIGDGELTLASCRQVCLQRLIEGAGVLLLLRVLTFAFGVASGPVEELPSARFRASEAATFRRIGGCIEPNGKDRDRADRERWRDQQISEGAENTGRGRIGHATCEGNGVALHKRLRDLAAHFHPNICLSAGLGGQQIDVALNAATTRRRDETDPVVLFELCCAGDIALKESSRAVGARHRQVDRDRGAFLPGGHAFVAGRPANDNKRDPLR
eukprot:scaffold1562_cov255-Pinguiococcus_pyrenoidosus.AAC.1